ncbi:N-acetylglucosaminyldiphosphoundecaprenol N-acetyl-beta-D-mannosaminyltransferase [Mariniphaga anaerophila]|uniref:N-acetylglucosaminyldiphosphoundecaprenol N-acetyl-beta-D-mannosaminyltransferase n=1 Tax=Mariniphaga anaerophila TaxID=1484053 RepID=A0A1M5BM64_9BACT|nr:WecB/TagA/CpsF family glycosyltransferase [Mariniphaga anaerophila]SHF43703.1 N-acetylglucosaminyldiphosphoundecaprenol N-acetyl-beta-D-mannosaminyltransferase [Mariniphaga anaerophila]
MPQTVSTMGYRVYSSSLDEINLETSQASLINTISPNSYGISTKDVSFREALKNSDYLVLDGVYFALSSIILQRKNIRKNQGPDVFFHFMQKANEKHGKVFFLGAAPKTLDKIKERAARDFPNISVETYSPPYKNDFSADDTNKMIEAVNAFNPDVLFVGMTCPKQEKWAYQNKTKLNTKLICCIGAVFDWYAGNQKEIHPLWWKLRLAWLKRTIDRPEILKRYPNIGIFFLHLLFAIIGIKKYKYGRF